MLGNCYVILPTVNELSNLKVLIPQLVESLPDLRILVVDDASNDGTQEWLDQIESFNPRIQSIRRPQRNGIGDAHIAGIEFAINNSATFVATMDADLTHRVEDLVRVFDSGLEEDLVVGSRYLVNASIEGWPVSRRFLTKLGHFFTVLAFQTNIDMSSGLRRYKCETFPLDLIRKKAPRNYEFFFWSILFYRKLNLSIGEVGITLVSRGSGSSKMSLKLLLRGITQLFIFGFRFKKL